MTRPTFPKLRLLALLFVTACTDASCARVTALGNAAQVTCFSGDSAIYTGRSTGKVQDAQGSDGYFFRDSASTRLVEVSGNCVLRYDP